MPPKEAMPSLTQVRGIGVRRLALICPVARGRLREPLREVAEALVERRVGLGQVRIGRQEIEAPVEVESRIAERPFGALEPEQVAVDDREQVIALESLVFGQLLAIEGLGLGAQRLQADDLGLDALPAPVRELARVFVLARRRTP